MKHYLLSYVIVLVVFLLQFPLVIASGDISMDDVYNPFYYLSVFALIPFGAYSFIDLFIELKHYELKENITKSVNNDVAVKDEKIKNKSPAG